MATFWQLRYLSIATILLSGFATAWTSSSLAVDLAWPSIGNEGYYTKNGQWVGPYVDQSAFPCATIVPPSSADSRIEFPLTGARLQFNLKNSTSHFDGHQFIVNAYLGQFSNDLTANKSSWAYIDDLVYDDIKTGSDCSNAIDIPTEVSSNPDFHLQLNSITNQGLVGVDVTLGLRIVLFDEDNNEEEMFQCSYLKLVAADAPVTQDRGTCNAGPKSSASPSSSATGLPSSSGTSMSSPTTNSGVGNASPSGDDHQSHSTIGIAVGVSVGVAALLLALGFVLLRRRRSSKGAKGTMALGFWVAGKEDDSAEKGEKEAEKKEKTKETESGMWQNNGKGKDERDGIKSHESNEDTSSRGSMHSEPLPVYQQEDAVDGGDETRVLKQEN